MLKNGRLMVSESRVQAPATPKSRWQERLKLLVFFYQESLFKTSLVITDSHENRYFKIVLCYILQREEHNDRINLLNLFCSKD